MYEQQSFLNDFHCFLVSKCCIFKFSYQNDSKLSFKVLEWAKVENGIYFKILVDATLIATIRYY